MKVAVVGVQGVPLGKHKVRDPHLDQADKLVKADTKTYASVDVAGEAEGNGDAHRFLKNCVRPSL